MWKVYIYTTDFEREVFNTIVESTPRDFDNRRMLAEILQVLPLFSLPASTATSSIISGITVSEEKNTEDTLEVPRIVDSWMRKYMDLTQLQRYCAMRPQLLALEQWFSLHYRRNFLLDITLLRLHESFNYLIGTYRWDTKKHHDHFWTLYFPVINSMYLLNDFEAGMVYVQLPKSVPLVESSGELQQALCDLFIEEVGTVCTKNGVTRGSYLHLDEIPNWKAISKIITEE